MALFHKEWNTITIHRVISEFLRAERDNFAPIHPPWTPLINSPNLDDPLENNKRLRLFYIKRSIFWIEIPLDTIWYEVNSLTANELDELYVSAKHNPVWDGAGNKLDRVAAVEKIPLHTPPEAWGRVILWGHNKDGPFSIIEVSNGVQF
jgi:hypothetical protein